MEEEGNIFPGCAQIDILGLVEGAVFSVNACVISEGVVNFNYISSLEKSPGQCKIFFSEILLQWLDDNDTLSG